MGYERRDVLTSVALKVQHAAILRDLAQRGQTSKSAVIRDLLEHAGKGGKNDAKQH